jgi:hypothetical protein
VLREYLTAPRVDLDLPGDGHPGPLEAEVEAADAGEQGQDIQGHGTMVPRKPALSEWRQSGG